MRGLELRKGTVDLVVNDLAPDVIWQLRAEGRLQVTSAAGTDYAYIGLNQRDPVLRNLDVRKAIGFAIDREAIVKYLAPRVRDSRGRDRAADVLGIRAQRVRLSPRSGGGAAAARCRGFSRSRWRWSEATVPAVAEDLDVRGLPRPGGGHPAGSGPCRYRGRRAIERAADAAFGRRARKLPDVHAAVGRRDRSGHAAARLPLEAGAAFRPQPGFLSERRSRSADRARPRPPYRTTSAGRSTPRRSG